MKKWLKQIVKIHQYFIAKATSEYVEKPSEYSDYQKIRNTSTLQPFEIKSNFKPIPKIIYQKLTIFSFYNLNNFQLTDNDILEHLLGQTKILFIPVFRKDTEQLQPFDYIKTKYRTLMLPVSEGIYFYWNNRFWFTHNNNFTGISSIFVMDSKHNLEWMHKPTESFQLPLIRLIWTIQLLYKSIFIKPKKYQNDELVIPFINYTNNYNSLWWSLPRQILYNMHKGNINIIGNLSWFKRKK